MYQQAIWTIIVLGCLTLGGPLTALAAPYTFMALDVPGATVTATLDINNHGDIVGYAKDSLITSETHGFLYHRGNFSVIDFPGASFTAAAGINDHGQIVGNYAIGTSPQRGFIYNGSGS